VKAWRQTNTKERWPWEYEGRDWSNFATNQGIPGVLETGRGEEKFFSLSSGESMVLLDAKLLASKTT
jgi:hypothetical protein